MSSDFVMTTRLLAGLSDIAPDYDALICDVWGVVHDGHHAHDAACDALRRFRQTRGPVVLLTNAPRVPSAVEEQFAGLKVPSDCYDVIVSSGGAARAELARRAAARTLPFYYIGTGRDVSIFDGLDVRKAPLDEAEVVLLTGMRDDDNEVPADYADELARVKARGLTMLCANPDLVVHRGKRLYWCAGALARDYAALGGDVVYYGKPHGPVYDMARDEIAARNPQARRFLCIGDGMPTDIKGANGQGLDVLFIADGIHGEDVEPYNPEHVTALLGGGGTHAAYALRALKW
jgi:HAD superfamily hydrolase (TIGR01459 family)